MRTIIYRDDAMSTLFRRHAAKRDELFACAIARDDESISFDQDSERYREIIGQRPALQPFIGPKRKPTERKRRILPQPLPRTEWPRIIRWLAKLQRTSDTGAGDTLARMADTFGAGRIAAKLKIPCGCERRWTWMNARYPYS